MLASEHAALPAGRAFDSLAYAKRLESNGFTRQQAEVLAEEQNKLIDERLATKTDIEHVRADIEHVRADVEHVRADVEALRIATKADIDALKIATKADLDAGLARTKAEIIMWVTGIGFAQVLAQVAMILGVLKFHG